MVRPIKSSCQSYTSLKDIHRPTHQGRQSDGNINLVLSNKPPSFFFFFWSPSQNAVKFLIKWPMSPYQLCNVSYFGSTTQPKHCGPAWLRLQVISKWNCLSEYLCEDNIARFPVQAGERRFKLNHRTHFMASDTVFLANVLRGFTGVRQLQLKYSSSFLSQCFC